jgi:hypothetical protein
MMHKVRWKLLPVAVVAVLAPLGSQAAGAGTCSGSTPQNCPIPRVVSGSATHVSTSSATLTGTVNPYDAKLTCTFKYGSSTKYGKSSKTIRVPAGSGTTHVRARVSGLSSGSRYDFELLCRNAGFTNAGANKRFKTRRH